MNAADPNEPAPGDPALKRRARAVFGVCMVANLAILFGYWAYTAGMLGVSLVLFGIAIAAGLAIFIAMEPLRREELRITLGKEPVAVPWYGWAGVLCTILVVCLLLNRMLGEPWRVGLAFSAGFGVYFALFVPLARFQRRGVKPYWRPAWYGFLLVGATAGLAWAVAAGQHPFEGLFKGTYWCAVHYAWVRWTTRRAAIQAALSAGGGGNEGIAPRRVDEHPMETLHPGDRNSPLEHRK